jgi:hypothetical protein
MDGRETLYLETLLPSLFTTDTSIAESDMDLDEKLEISCSNSYSKSAMPSIREGYRTNIRHFFQ